MINHRDIASRCMILPYKADFDEDYLQVVQFVEREILKIRRDSLGAVEDLTDQLLQKLDSGWVDLGYLMSTLRAIKEICRHSQKETPDAD